MAEIKLFNVVEVIGNLIEDNISDLDCKSRWVFPTFATNDSQLPQVTVKLLSPTYEDDAAGSFLSEEVLVGDIVYKEYYYKKAIVPVNLYVRTGKTQEFTVGSGDDEMYLKNQPLNIYLAEQIKNLLWLKQENSDTFQDEFERVKVLGMDLAFEDTDTTWSSEIQVEVKYKDVWVKEYDVEGVVSEYSLTVNTY